MNAESIFRSGLYAFQKAVGMLGGDPAAFYNADQRRAQDTIDRMGLAAHRGGMPHGGDWAASMADGLLADQKDDHGGEIGAILFGDDQRARTTLDALGDLHEAAWDKNDAGVPGAGLLGELLVGDISQETLGFDLNESF